MVFLILSILLMVILNFIFKIFSLYNIRNFHAIIINYLCCFIIGCLFFDFQELADVFQKPWFTYSTILSFAFIIGFNILAATIKHFGIALGTLMQRMSLVVTAGVSILLYNESLALFKILGILFGILSIFLVSRKILPDHVLSSSKFSKLLLILPILTLLSSAVVDLGLQYTERYYLEDGDWHSFNATLFVGAGILGFVFLLIRSFFSGERVYFKKKEIIGGIALGIPNYFSIYTLVQALNHGFEGSFLFPVMNVSIILLSVLGSVLFFKESLTKRQGLGILIACIALAFLSMSN